MRCVVLVEGRCCSLLRMLIARQRGAPLRLCRHSPGIGGVRGLLLIYHYYWKQLFSVSWSSLGVIVPLAGDLMEEIVAWLRGLSR